MVFNVYNKNQKSLTVENLNMKLFFQTEFVVQEKGLPLHKQLHKHSYVEIFACIEGKISINTSDGHTVELYSGDMAMVPSAVAHFKEPETAPDTDWIGMGFICREVQGDFANDLYGSFAGVTDHGSILVYRDMPHLCRMVKQCHEMNRIKEVSSVLVLISELIKLPKVENVPDDNNDEENTQKAKNIDRLLKLDDIINTNFTSNFTNKEIADLLFISERQLSRIVAKNYGQPLRLIIMKKRLDIAAELLLTTSNSVEQITSSVGFRNKNSFHREFKKRFGVTPAEYRKTSPI